MATTSPSPSQVMSPTTRSSNELIDSQGPSSTLLRHWTRTWMTQRSASCSPKYTEITPITGVQKVNVSVRRLCLSRPIERGNLWARATSISLVLVSETCAVLTISFLQSPKLKKWSIERGNPWKQSLELLRSGKALVHRLGLCSMNEDEMIIAECCEKVLITNSK